jgi:GT2 family glycosyltransferase
LTVIGVSVVLYRSQPAAVVATMTALAAQLTPPGRIEVHVNEADQVDLERLDADLRAALGTISFAVDATSENLGFTGGHNAVLARLFAADCSAVVVLNPDLMLNPTALQELAAAEADLPAASLLGPLLVLADPSTLQETGLIDSLGIRWTVGGRHLDAGQGEPLTPLPPQPKRVAGISGACLYVPRAAYDRILAASDEFFDADFIAYREDAELAIRADVLGIGSYLVPRARGAHVRGLRGTTRGGNTAIDALGVRNRFLMAFKYGLKRPGNSAATLTRDGVVVAGVLLRERTSLPALREAWHLRGAMRAKGRRITEFMRQTP